MDLGTKITQLRKQHNMTQQELGDILNISPQAISKWEKNASEPDLQCIKEMSKIFNVPIVELVDSDMELSTKEDTKQEANYVAQTQNSEQGDAQQGETRIVPPPPPPPRPQQDTQNNANNQTYTCQICQRSFNEKDMFKTSPNPVCINCNNMATNEKREIENIRSYANGETEQIKNTTTNNKDNEPTTKSRKTSLDDTLIDEDIWTMPRRLGWSCTWAGIVLAGLLALFIGTKVLDIGIGIAIAVVCSLLTFTFVFQLRADTFIDDFADSCTGKFIDMPGVIFFLDIESILLALLYKIIIAPIIIIGVAIIFFVFGNLIAILLSPLTFFFALPHVIEESKNARN